MLLESGLPVVIVRPSHVYGAGGWYAQEMLPRLRQPGRFAVIGNGSNMWDVVHVQDVVAALIARRRGGADRARPTTWPTTSRSRSTTSWRFSARELGVGPPAVSRRRSPGSWRAPARSTRSCARPAHRTRRSSASWGGRRVFPPRARACPRPSPRWPSPSRRASNARSPRPRRGARSSARRSPPATGHCARAAPLGSREGEIVDQPPSRPSACALYTRERRLRVGGLSAGTYLAAARRTAAQRGVLDLAHARPPPAREHPPGARPGERVAAHRAAQLPAQARASRRGARSARRATSPSMPPGEVDAQERERRVGHRVDQRAHKPAALGAQTQVGAAERDDPRIGARAGRNGEPVGPCAGAEHRMARLGDAAGVVRRMRRRGRRCPSPRSPWRQCRPPRDVLRRSPGDGQKSTMPVSGECSAAMAAYARLELADASASRRRTPATPLRPRRRSSSSRRPSSEAAVATISLPVRCAGIPRCSQ